jgi:hypothetical protein
MDPPRRRLRSGGRRPAAGGGINSEVARAPWEGMRGSRQEGTETAEISPFSLLPAQLHASMARLLDMLQ